MNKEMKEAIEEMATTIAHEVKNPLALIKANIEFLELNDNIKANAKHYDSMKNEINKINNLILNFLQITKITEIKKDLVYLNDIIKDILREYRILFETKNIHFTYLCEEADACILGNENDVKIVLYNLLKNAVEAIKENGKIKIKMKVKNEERSIVVTISDNGIGFEPKYKTKIFNKFYTTKTEGSGVGLSICQNIVKEHNGKLNIFRTESQLTVAKIIFPAYINSINIG